MVNGITMYLDEIGSQMAGRKGRADRGRQSGPTGRAVTKLRKVVEHDRVQLVAGVLFGHIGTRWPPRSRSTRSGALHRHRRGRPHAAPEVSLGHPHRLGIEPAPHPFGEYVAKTLGHRKVAVIASDYAFGWEVVGGFQRTFEENGGQVIQKLWTPLGRDGPRAVHRQDPA